MPDIEDMEIRRCPHCNRYYVADEQMFENPERCPHCGRDLAPADYGNEEVQI
jgi:rRNA maturation protein Nop10